MQKGAKTVQKRNKGGEVSKTIYPTRNISATQDTGKSSGKVVAVSGHQMVPISCGRVVRDFEKTRCNFQFR